MKTLNRFSRWRSKFSRAWNTWRFNVLRNPQLQVRWQSHSRKSDSFSTRRLALISAYSASPSLDPHTRHLAQNLSSLGFRVVLVVTSPRFEPASFSGPWETVWRHNAGFDFGSWSFALRWLGIPLESIDELILANDSVIGPFFSLEPIYNEMTSRPLDAWGLSDNGQEGRHIQSYFVVLRKRALLNLTVAAFLKNPRSLYRKSSAILHRERAFSALLTQARLDWDTWVHASAVQAWANSHRDRTEYWNILPALPKSQDTDDVNPTLFLWDVLIEEFRFPFLKRELLTRNRFRSSKIHQWQALVQKSQAFDATFPFEETASR